jgi:signal transduction histidine kinase
MEEFGMRLTLPEVLNRLNGMRDRIHEIFRSPADVDQRAADLARVVQLAWPGAAMHMAVILGGQEHGISVHDRSGRVRSDWANVMRTSPMGDSDWCPGLPSELESNDGRLVWEFIADVDRCRGGLGVCVLTNLSADREQVLRMFLRTASALVAARLNKEESVHQQFAEKAQASLNLALADVGEVASPLAHELNNFLNALLLHVAVLEIKMPPDQRDGLAQIRRQGKEMAAMVQLFQQYDRRPLSEDLTTDLNEALRQSVESTRNMASAEVTVRLEPEPGRLIVPGATAEIERLCKFLVKNAIAVTVPGGQVVVKTARVDDQAVLCVEDSGPTVPPDQLSELFAAYPQQRPGTSSFELAACKGITRRLQGRIVPENRTEGGISITVELKLA